MAVPNDQAHHAHVPCPDSAPSQKKKSNLTLSPNQKLITKENVLSPHLTTGKFKKRSFTYIQ